MALPTGPIPLVAVGEIIEENWGDSVAQSLNNLAQRRDADNWKPSADIDAPIAGTMTTWFNFGGGAGTDITVPDWAQNAYARIEINGVVDTGSSTNNTFDLQLFIGTEAGRIIRQTATSDIGYFPIGWTSRIDVSDLAGARKLIVKVAKVSGGSGATWRIDTDSDVAFDIVYSGAIDFYPGL